MQQIIEEGRRMCENVQKMITQKYHSHIVEPCPASSGSRSQTEKKVKNEKYNKLLEPQLVIKTIGENNITSRNKPGPVKRARYQQITKEEQSLCKDEQNIFTQKYKRNKIEEGKGRFASKM